MPVRHGASLPKLGNEVLTIGRADEVVVSPQFRYVAP